LWQRKQEQFKQEDSSVSRNFKGGGQRRESVENPTCGSEGEAAEENLQF